MVRRQRCDAVGGDRVRKSRFMSLNNDPAPLPETQVSSHHSPLGPIRCDRRQHFPRRRPNPVDTSHIAVYPLPFARGTRRRRPTRRGHADLICPPSRAAVSNHFRELRANALGNFPFTQHSSSISLIDRTTTLRNNITVRANQK